MLLKNFVVLKGLTDSTVYAGNLEDAHIGEVFATKYQVVNGYVVQAVVEVIKAIENCYDTLENVGWLEQLSTGGIDTVVTENEIIKITNGGLSSSVKGVEMQC